jgi:tetratricopeptide (TPR) repeat protein
MPPMRRHGLLSLLASLAVVSGASAQVAPEPAPRAQDAPPPPRASREATWPAPTAEDWKKPCLIEWQRSWYDAQAVAKETGKPIMVCINMDGEIASEHYAGVRYRQPEIAKLYDRYVCVIASVYRHTPRDFDEQGHRIPCPRFGSVTCGEHIAIEPYVHDRFMDGQRIAPRHIGVNDKQGDQEMYDVFYAWTTEAVFDAIRTGVAEWPEPLPLERGERSPVDLLASRDHLARVDVETAYDSGDRQQRRVLLEAVVARPDEPPLDLLRLALRDPDPDLARLARQALARSTYPGAIDLLTEALGQAVEADERASLIAALERIGKEWPRARTLSVAYRGLADASSAVDEAAWASALQAGPSPEQRAARSARLAEQDAIFAGEDAAAHLELAEALLSLAASEPDAEAARYVSMDAQRAAKEAVRLGAGGARAHAALALAAFQLQDLDTALQHAAEAGGVIPADAAGKDGLALLWLFARSRQQAIAQASLARRDWPAAWLADVHAAYEVLALHPLADDSHVVMHYDFLKWFGATAAAGDALDAGLVRFPDSPVLHDRLRARLLDTRGAAGLERWYEERLRDSQAPPGLERLAASASLVAAEYQRRAGRPDDALAAYDRGIAHAERSLVVDPQGSADADRDVALALGGRARLAFERGDDATAVEQLLACFARQPTAAAILDGLNVSAVETSRLVLARLRANGPAELTKQLEDALASLDPVLLQPAEYDRNLPGEPPPRPTPPPGG